MIEGLNESPLTPVAFLSHGSPFMCCKESASSEWWAKFGKEALSQNIKGIVLVGAHWEERADRIRVAAKFDPNKVQMDMVPRSYWEKYPINVAAGLVSEVIGLLRKQNFVDVEADHTFDWHDDTITPLRWMFPEGSPPATVVSLNARYNPIFHVKIGKALASLRGKGVLIVGTGGAVHNLYRNNWLPLLRYNDNFQKGSKPASWATAFDRAVVDTITYNKGAELAGALLRLTLSPGYKDAHPTDDHFFPLLVVAGAVMEANEAGMLMAQTWELQNMCNSQFLWGSWQAPHISSSAVDEYAIEREEGLRANS